MARVQTGRKLRYPVGVAGVFGLLAIIGLLAAQGAAGKPPRSFYGVVPQTALGPEDYQRMGQGRVGTLRTPLVWAFVDPSPAAADYAWGELDKLVAGAAVAGIRVLPTVTSTPPWVSEIDNCPSNCFKQPPHSEAALLAWRLFLRAAVERYGPDGAFWVENPTIPKVPITTWQIWNEQNSPTYFAPKPDPDVYAKLVTEASRAIKALDPNAKVILGGMFATPLGKDDPDTNSWTYLRKLYGKPGIESRFDGVAAHPYSQSIKGVRQQLKLLLKEMRRAGDAGTGLWVTEIGWSSEPKDREIPLNRGPKGQAKKLRQAYTYFARKRGVLHLKLAAWFSWQDTSPQLAQCIWCPASGLFARFELDPKPAWKAFVKFTGGR